MEKCLPRQWLAMCSFVIRRLNWAAVCVVESFRYLSNAGAGLCSAEFTEISAEILTLGEIFLCDSVFIGGIV